MHGERSITPQPHDKDRHMSALRMVSWKEGLQVVSLIKDVRDFSTGSLASAKEEVERLLDGQSVTLHFSDGDKKKEFRRRAELLGAVFG
jgi:hypothetical protein